MSDTNRQIVLDQLPQGKLAPDHFRLVESPVPTPGDGEVLLRTRYISLDAANRAWMQGATYRSALNAGQVMAGGALAEVRESRAPHLKPGDLVFADTGWQDYAVLPAAHLAPLPRLEPATHLLSVYGIAGLTAYFGLLKCGRPKAGETVVVSAAAGSVGSLVGQIGSGSFFLIGVSETFAAGTSGLLKLFYFDSNNYDNFGQISVTVSAVPLPAAGWLMLSGLAAFGAFGRRRRVVDAGEPVAAA